VLRPWQSASVLGFRRRDRLFNPATPSRVPTSRLFSHPLPNLMVVPDFGNRMGATMSAQVRLDAVIVAAGRFLASPDISFRSSVTRYPVCVVVIEVAVRTASQSAGRPRRPLSFVARRYSSGLLDLAVHPPHPGISGG
jgi:hypothetical protein